MAFGQWPAFTWKQLMRIKAGLADEAPDCVRTITQERIMSRLSKIALLFAAALGFVLSATAALAYQNTIRIVVNPERMWQCGDGFFANGGSERYQIIRVMAQGVELGRFDLAKPSDCTKVLEYVVDLPDSGSAVTQIEVGGNTMDATVTGRDRNRIWTLFAFVDSFWGQLTEDYVADRSDSSSSVAARPGEHTQTIELQVAPGRVWQCGNNFYANGGSDTYRYGVLYLDNREVARYDFAAEEDCTRIVTVTREMLDAEHAEVAIEVGPYRMVAGLTARDWARVWRVYFFVDQIWGEVLKDLNQ